MPRLNARGLAFVELLILIQVIAIIGGIAVPELQSRRTGANESAALDTLGLLGRAELDYQSTVGNGSFGNPVDLFVNGFIDPATAGATGVPPGTRSNFGQMVPLAQGDWRGYRFSLTAGPLVTLCPVGDGDFTTSEVIAEPVAPGRTGRRLFLTCGTTVPICTPPSHLDEKTLFCSQGNEPTDAAAVSAILAVNQVSGGVALRGAIDAGLSPDTIQRVLRLIDADNDGLITFRETIEADLLGITRALVPTTNAAIDRNLRPLFDIQNDLSADLRRQLMLFLDNGQQFAVPRAGRRGDPNRLLQLAQLFAK